MRPAIPILALSALLAGCGGEPPAPPGADLLLHGGRIWTGDPARPRASWIAIRGREILALGGGEDAAPPAARTIDLDGRLVVPGFNDTHVHFASAGALLLGVNLLDVSDDGSFRDRVLEAASRLREGSWITGGDWGAYEAWELGSDGRRRGETSYRPRRQLIDDDTAGHPVLVTRFDGELGLANRAALEALGLESETGILQGKALAAALRQVPERSLERRLAESRRALEECRRWGVTSVQDMSPPDQVEVYRRLREAGELTCRIHFSPSRLPEYEEMIDRGWTVGAGDHWLRFGTIKTHIDGIMGNRSARFFEPYADNAPEEAGWRGGWREFSADLPRFEEMLTAADAAGIQLRVHAIGDQANALLVDMLERIEAANGPRDRRFRLVHAQVVRRGDLPRMGALRMIAEVQPYHCIDDMRWMEERIGRERSRGAYAFRSLQEAGLVLAFGSDWPGTNASYYPVNPLSGLYAAVTRRTLKGTPAGGWFPEERIDLEDALRAYTRAGAYASFEEDRKGILREGMLADLAVLERDLFAVPPEEWLRTWVDTTIVGGRVVFDRNAEPGPAR